jgi:RNA polymerase primary sigma factor
MSDDHNLTVTETPTGVIVGAKEISFIELEALIEAAERNAQVTIEDVAHALKDVEVGPAAFEVLVDSLGAVGIDVHDHSVDEVHLEGPHGSRSVKSERGRPPVAKKVHGPLRVERPLGDATDAYLREIGRVPLLTAEEEIELSTRLHDGEEAARRLEAAGIEGVILDPEVASTLNFTVKRGAKARARLIESNLRLVVSIAKRYRRDGIAMLDLIQEGNIGLMKAVEKFDPTKGFRFSTYASFWIRQSLSRAVAEQGRSIRIPVHLVELINRIKGAQREFVQVHHREPTMIELGAELHLDPNRIEELLIASQEILSTDQPLSSEDGFTLGDTIGDPSIVDVETDLDLDDQLSSILGSLDVKDREVVTLRFGLGSNRPHTLEEVGKILGVTKERARQRELRALARLKREHGIEELKSYLSND